MPLTLVKPAYDGKPVDNHTFRCAACGLIETYVFDRGHSSCCRPLVRACPWSKDEAPAHGQKMSLTMLAAEPVR